MSNLPKHELYDIRPHEMINGKIIGMSPLPLKKHSIVSGNIYGIFYYLKGKRCVVYKEDTYVRLDKIQDVDFSKVFVDKKKSRLVPDIMVVCNPDIDKDDGIYGAPDLVVEVLSKGTKENDKGIKKYIYELIGVKEYWIVGVEERAIEVYLLKDGKYILDKVYERFSDEDIANIMEDEDLKEKISIIREFKTSIFDDLIILLADVFDKVE